MRMPTFMTTTFLPAFILVCVGSCASKPRPEIPDHLIGRTLGTPLAFPAKYREAVSAAAASVADPGDYYVEVEEASGPIYVLHLWHQSAFLQENLGKMGNPGGKCRDIRFDPLQKRVVEFVLAVNNRASLRITPCSRSAPPLRSGAQPLVPLGKHSGFALIYSLVRKRAGKENKKARSAPELGQIARFARNFGYTDTLCEILPARKNEWIFRCNPILTQSLAKRVLILRTIKRCQISNLSQQCCRGSLPLLILKCRCPFSTTLPVGCHRPKTETTVPCCSRT
jgi:hypothetical protein